MRHHREVDRLTSFTPTAMINDGMKTVGVLDTLTTRPDAANEHPGCEHVTCSEGMTLSLERAAAAAALARRVQAEGMR